MTKTLKVLLSLLILLAIQPSLFAQTGCLLPDTKIYTSKINPGLINVLLGTTPIYENDPSILLAAQCMSAPGGQCRVCPGTLDTTLGLITGCSSGFIYGSEVAYTLACPLDSYTLTLLLMGTSLGAFSIHKRNKR